MFLKLCMADELARMNDIAYPMNLIILVFRLLDNGIWIWFANLF